MKRWSPKCFRPATSYAGCCDPEFCRAAGECILRPFPDVPRNEKGRSHGPTEPGIQASGSLPATSTENNECHSDGAVRDGHTRRIRTASIGGE